MTNLDQNRQVVSSHYRESPVPISLANYFLCFGKQVIIGSVSYVHRVLPDACVDIVFINDAPPVVVGPWTDPFVVRFPAGTKRIRSCCTRLRSSNLYFFSNWFPK